MQHESISAYDVCDDDCNFHHVDVHVAAAVDLVVVELQQAETHHLIVVVDD